MPSVLDAINNFERRGVGGIQRFPTQLFETGLDKYMLFQPIYQEKAFFRNQAPEASTGYAIALPIPGNLNESTSMAFGEQGLGIIEGPLDDAISKVANLNFSGAAEEVKANKERYAQNIATSMFLNAANNAREGTSTFTSAYLGVANPYLKNIFSGIGFKQHTFVFQCVARNEQDSKAIRNIINTLRLFSAPRGQNAAILDVQYFWEISFEPSRSVGQWLYDIQPSWLTNMSVSYNTQNASAFHPNGAPLDVVIALQFSETEIASAEYYEETYKEQGIPQGQGGLVSGREVIAGAGRLAEDVRNALPEASRRVAERFGTG